MEHASGSPETVVRIERSDLPTTSSPDPTAPPETRGKRITVQLLSSGAGMELIYDGNRDAMVVVDHNRKGYVVVDHWMRATPVSKLGAMAVSDTGERATKQGHPSRKVDLRREGRKTNAVWIADDGEGDEVLPAPVASMVQFAIFYQQAQQRLNQRQRLGGGDDDEDDQDDKPPEDDFFSEVMRMIEKWYQQLWDLMLDIEGGVYNGEEDEEEDEEEEGEDEDDGDFDDWESDTDRKLDPDDFEPPEGYKRRSLGPYEDPKPPSDEKKEEKDN